MRASGRLAYWPGLPSEELKTCLPSWGGLGAPLGLSIKSNIKKYVKTKAKEYNWVIKNDRLYVKTSNPRANKYDEITGKQLVRIDNEYFYYELIYSEKAPENTKQVNRVGQKTF